MMTPVALTIAGSDPSGGAGLQADLKTFHHFGVYGMSVVTVLTVQNTQRLDDVQLLDPAFVAAQLDAVIGDIPPAAAKTGALGSADIIDAIADRAESFDFPLVVDPVMISKHNEPLLDDDAIEVLRTRLLQHAFLVTPNMHEAAALAGRPVTSIAQMRDAARALADLGPKHVLVKGGRLPDGAVDVLFSDGTLHAIPAPHIDTPHTHGTGCAYAAAITAGLARGHDLREAVTAAKSFITQAIQSAPGLGRGRGPVNFHAMLESAFTPADTTL